MSATNDFEKWIGDQIFGTTESGISSAPAGTLYLALHTGDPEDAGANEVASSYDYARVDVGSSSNGGSAMFTYDSSNDRWDNDAAITFATASGGSWGTVTHAALWDSSSGGNCICAVDINDEAITDGKQASFAAGQIYFTVT
tara:strand:- start:863 stop:1288 length:426 start_codon:yes stop_codon:yes gene_type:complete